MDSVELKGRKHTTILELGGYTTIALLCRDCFNVAGTPGKRSHFYVVNTICHVYHLCYMCIIRIMCYLVATHVICASCAI